MAVAAHHNEVRGNVRRVGQEHVGDVDVAHRHALDLNIESVAGKVLTHVGAGDLILLAAFVGDDTTSMRPARRLVKNRPMTGPTVRV